MKTWTNSDIIILHAAIGWWYSLLFSSSSLASYCWRLSKGNRPNVVVWLYSNERRERERHARNRLSSCGKRVWRKVDIAIEAGNWPSYLALPERLVAELCKESSYLIHQQDPTRVISRCESVSCASERVIVTPRSPPCRHRATSSAQAIHIYNDHFYHFFVIPQLSNFPRNCFGSQIQSTVRPAGEVLRSIRGRGKKIYLPLSLFLFLPSSSNYPVHKYKRFTNSDRPTLLSDPSCRADSVNQLYTWCSSSWNYDLTFFRNQKIVFLPSITLWPMPKYGRFVHSYSS